MPIFGRTVQEVISVSESDESSAVQLSQVVLKDASMTGRVLKLANSAYYKRGEQKLDTISRAITLLGFNTVRSMCLTVALIDSVMQGNNREHLVREMARSLHAATQAKMLAEERKDKCPEEIYISTLLYNIGDLAFWCFCGEEEGEKIDAALQKPGVTLVMAQREVLGFTLNELSAGLAKTWSISDLLITTLENPNSNDERTRSIKLSHKLAVAAEQGWGAEEVIRLSKEITGLTSSKNSRITAKLHQGARQAVENSSHYGASVVAQIIPLPPQPKDKQVEVKKESSTQYPEPNSGLQLKILQQLTKLVTRTTDLNMVMEMILEGIHSGVGMDRALFALMTPDRQSIHAKYVLGDEGGMLQKNFTFRFDNKSARILQYCIKQEEPLWMDKDKSENLSALLSKKLTDVTGTAAFVIAPIVVKGKVIGLYYADRGLSRRKLVQDNFDNFQFFAQQSNLILNHLASRK